ncbi:MAG: sigma-54 dependent transcriptional regulator [bacterium]
MPRILVVDDEARMAALIRRELEDEGYDVVTASDGEAALEQVAAGELDLVVTDLKMPGMDGIELLREVKGRDADCEVILMTAYASAETAVEAMKEGAYDYLVKPFEMAELVMMVERITEHQRLRAENRQLKEDLSSGAGEIIGTSPGITKVMELVRRVAGQATTVLIQGESGTGKELVARTIHASSRRSEEAFVAVNCGAIPDTLIESELFGHEKGAYTGASSRRLGKFELANRGTVFLDEVGELAPQAQVKLLRVLQERYVERLGGTRPVPVDVRVLAATNRDLHDLVSREEFREDLFYRLNVFPIHIPPLRSRREDIPLLARHFLEEHGRENTFTDEVMRMLVAYPWPGNVRELENIIERALILAGPGNEVLPEHLSTLEGRGMRPMPGQEEEGPPVHIPEEGVDLEEVEKRHILEALRKADGNKSEAARLLHITRRRLYSRMKHHDIDY